MRTSAPPAFASSSVRSEPGTRIMSPKQVKMTPVALGDRHPVVDPAHRDHADRAARPVDQLDLIGQQVVDPVPVDRVGVAAADLHQLVVAAGLDQGGDLRRQRSAQLGVAELVDEPHRASSSFAIAVPAWTSRSSPTATGATRATSTVSSPPRLVGAPRQPLLVVEGDHPQLHRDVAAGDADVLVHSMTLAFSSSSSCSYSAPISSSSFSVASASASSIFEIANPTWIRTQSPTRGAAVLVVEQPDADVAPDSGDVDLGEPVLLIDDL